MRLDAELCLRAQLNPVYYLTSEARGFVASYVPLRTGQQIEDDVDLALNSQQPKTLLRFPAAGMSLAW